MAYRPTRLAIAIVVLVGTAAAAAAGARPVAAGNPCFHSYTVPPASDGATDRVSLGSCDFAPTVTRVAPGTTVSFVNTSPFSHLVSGANGAWGSREVEVQPGSTISYRFDEPGIYPYACSLHPGMAGAIVVGDVEPAAATDRPTGEVRSSESVGIATDGLVTAGAGVLGLLLIGGAGVWFATRRRRG